MPDTAPLTQTLKANVNAVATVGNTEMTMVGEAPFDGTVTRVTYLPKATQNGANTNSRTLNLYNRGQTGNGTTLVATLALVSGVNLTDNDAKELTLSGTAANLVLASGDVLEFESLAVGTGIADPGGQVQVTVSRN